MSYTSALFFIGLCLFSCSIADKSDSESVSNNEDEIKSASPEPLSSKIFPPQLVDLLSPKLFVHPDPVRFLARIVANKSYKEARLLLDLRCSLWLHQIKFPPQYLPYANVLTELLMSRRFLEDARVTIRKMQNSSDLTLPPVPLGLLSPDLSDLFSTEIFTDDEPLFQLLIRLANVPEDKVKNVRIESKNVLDKKDLPSVYFSYAKDLMIYMRGEFNLPTLVQRVSKLRDVINSKLSNPVSLNP